MTVNAPSSKSKQCADQVAQERSRLAQHEADHAAASVELEDLQSRVGSQVLDTPGSTAALGRSMQELRDRIYIGQQAIDAQRLRVTAAERAYLTAEAGHLEASVLASARAALGKHEARTAQLLEQLEEHEGRYVPEIELIQEQSDHADFVAQSPVGWVSPRSFALRAAVREAEVRVQVLRMLAEGVDPHIWLQEQISRVDGTVAGQAPSDLYAPCVWGPDAIVPAPAYLRTVTGRSNALQSLVTATIPGLEQNVAQLQVELDEAKARGDIDELRITASALQWAPTVADRLKAAQDQLQNARARAARERTQFEALTGIGA